MDDKAFHEFLEYADRVVRSWPEWKQTCLGAQAKKQEPREPVDNFQHVADCLRTENKKLQQTNEDLRRQLAETKTGHEYLIERLQLGSAGTCEPLRSRVKELEELVDNLWAENRACAELAEELRKQLAQVVRERDECRENNRAVEDTYFAYKRAADVVRDQNKALLAERNMLADKVSAAFNILGG